MSELLCSAWSFTDQPLSRKSSSCIRVLKYISGLLGSARGGERGGGCLAAWLFCVFGSVEFLEIVVGKARALFLSCDGEGIAKRCFRTRVWVNVQILLSLSSRLGPEYKYGNGYEAEKPPMSMCWVLILAGFCIKPFYRLRLFLGG